MKDTIKIIAIATAGTIAVLAVLASFFGLINYLGQALHLMPHELTVFGQFVFYIYLLVGKCILDRI